MTVRSRVLALGTVAALSIGGAVVGVAHAQAAPVPTPLITDTNLLACITQEIGLTGLLHDLLTALGLGAVLPLLGELDCTGAGVTDLSGLQAATGLDDLDLDGNSILDPSVLGGLDLDSFSASGLPSRGFRGSGDWGTGGLGDWGLGSGDVGARIGGSAPHTSGLTIQDWRQPVRGVA